MSRRAGSRLHDRAKQLAPLDVRQRRVKGHLGAANRLGSRQPFIDPRHRRRTITPPRAITTAAVLDANPQPRAKDIRRLITSFTSEKDH